VAVTFASTSRTLTIYVDGVFGASGVLDSTSLGTTQPVEIGRNGPSAGKYFQGKLDDMRIWNVVRTPAQIAANYSTQLSSVPAGLVANWRFDDPDGPTAKDSADSHDATLGGGAVFSPNVHP
jgi:hypothetical protein